MNLSQPFLMFKISGPPISLNFVYDRVIRNITNKTTDLRKIYGHNNNCCGKLCEYFSQMALFFCLNIILLLAAHYNPRL